MQYLKKDYRQKDEITLRCCICSIGIGNSKLDKKWHSHLYKVPIFILYKKRKYIVDEDCFKLVKKNPKLLDNAYYDTYNP